MNVIIVRKSGKKVNIVNIDIKCFKGNDCSAMDSLPMAIYVLKDLFNERVH